MTPTTAIAHAANAVAGIRATIRCRHCSLVQFVPASGDCRKCRRPLTLSVAAVAEPAAAPVKVAVPKPLPVEALPSRLRALRVARGWTQPDLARRMGLPRTYISKLENGKVTPTLRSLLRLCEALQVEPYVLLAEEFPTFVLYPMIAEIAACLPRMDEVQRNTLLTLARDAASFAKERVL